MSNFTLYKVSKFFLVRQTIQPQTKQRRDERITESLTGADEGKEHNTDKMVYRMVQDNTKRVVVGFRTEERVVMKDDQLQRFTEATTNGIDFIRIRK